MNFFGFIRLAAIRRALALTGILFLSTLAFSQTYHATGNPFYQPPLLFTEPTGRTEFAFSGMGQSALIVDPEDQPFTRVQWGGNVRGLYYFSDMLALGISATRLTGIMRNKALSSVKWLRLGAAAKLILTPQVTPRVYILTEAGLDTRTSRDIINGAQSARGLYLRAGAGTEWNLSHSIGLFFEYAFVYSSLPNINKLMCHPTRWNQDIAVGLSFYW